MDPTMQQVLNLQDVELMNAMSQLRGDQGKLQEYVSGRKAELYGRIAQEHSDTFQKVYGDMVRASNTNNNILYYHVRNKDLDKLQQAIMARTKGEADAATYDSQTAKRQFEVNEWTTGNKQDSLFFLQLLFISLTIMAILVFYQKKGVIPSSVVYGVSSLFSIALILTLLVRYRYTMMTRDNRYWNRRRFQKMGGPPAAPNCEAVTAAMDNMKTKQSALADWTKGFEERAGNVLNQISNVASVAGGYNPSTSS